MKGEIDLMHYLTHGLTVPLASCEVSIRDHKKEKNTLHLDSLYDVKSIKCSSACRMIFHLFIIFSHITRNNQLVILIEGIIVSC